MGMAHRGRLNVLANIVGNADTGDLAERIFTVFEGTSHPSFPADEGDVKYHQGALGSRKTKNGNNVKITFRRIRRTLNLLTRLSKEWPSQARRASRRQKRIARNRQRPRFARFFFTATPHLPGRES
jgi:hypothetical protein